MYVLDTNVASELMRPTPASIVTTWIAERDTEDMFLTAISEAELLYGVAIVLAGRRRKDLETAITRWLSVGFGKRILPFDSAAVRGGPSKRLTVRLPLNPAPVALSCQCATSRI